MPRLPKYESQQIGGAPSGGVRQFDYPNVRASDLAAPARGFEEAAQVSENLANVADKLYKSSLNREIDHAKVEITKRFTDFETSTDQRKDYNVWDKELDDHVKDLHKKFVETSSHKDAAAEVNSFLQFRQASTRRSVFTKGLKMKVDEGRAQIYTEMLDLMDRIPQLTDLGGRVRLIDDLRELLQAGEADGFLGSLEGMKMYEDSLGKIRQDISIQRAREIGYENGIVAIQTGTLFTPEEEKEMGLRPLSEDEQQALITDIRREWGLTKAIKREEEEAQYEATNNDFVNKMHGNQLTKEAVLDSGLPPDGHMGKQWWIDTLDNRADAILRGEDDPYKNTTDFEGYGLLMSKVMQDPTSVSDGDIWEHHGVGIGTADCYRLANIRDGKFAKDPEQKSLHKRWTTHLVWCRKEGVWDSGSSMAARQRNNAKFMEFSQALDGMFEQNPDINNEEVQKWFDENITPDEESAIHRKLREWWEAISSMDFGSMSGNIAGVPFEVGANAPGSEPDQGAAELEGLRPGRYELDSGAIVVWDGVKIVRYE